MPDTAQTSPAEDVRDDFRRASLLVAVGWLTMSLASGLVSLPFQFLLKEGLHFQASDLAGFMAIANIPTYIKPLTGILSDSVPFFRTRRRHYLIWGCAIAGLLWLALGFVPHVAGWLLATYFTLNIFLVLISTVQGGLMVDVGVRHNATGRLSAQRVGITRIESLLSGPLGGKLATFPFMWAACLPAILCFSMVPAYIRTLKEPPTAAFKGQAWRDSAQQFRTLLKSKTLWSAAGLVMLVIASPGFGSPLLYYQTNVLGFKKEFIGLLGSVNGAFCMVGALIYAAFCRRYSLRVLLTTSILIHAGGTLFYLAYRTPASAIAITALEGVAQTLAILPLYDLAARATPKGSEALGYSVMMSVWNLTASLSNVVGAKLYDVLGWSVHQLVWLNAGTTLLVLFAIPFLPKVLMERRDGEKATH